MTWVYGADPAPEDVGEVEARLSPAGDGRTLLELEHAMVKDLARWAEYGPGDVGVGWDLAVLGLGLHLARRLDRRRR